jgi:hypothetical protein
VPQSLAVVKAKQDARRAKGLCPRCGARRRGAYTLCPACRDIATASRARSRMRRARAGLCARCGRAPPMTGRVHCRNCLTAWANYHRERRRGNGS